MSREQTHDWRIGLAHLADLFRGSDEVVSLTVDAQNRAAKYIDAALAPTVSGGEGWEELVAELEGKLQKIEAPFAFAWKLTGDAAWTLTHNHPGYFRATEATVKALYDRPAPTLPDDLLSLSEAATAALAPFAENVPAEFYEDTDFPDWSPFIPAGAYRRAAEAVNFIRTLAARQNRAGETT